MRATYLASLAHRRGRRAHVARYVATYRVLIPVARLVARRGPVELTIRLVARWGRGARIVWSLDDGRGWTDDVGDQLDDLATVTSLALRDRLVRRRMTARRDLERLERLARMR